MSKQMLELADRLAGSLQPFNFLTRDERDLIIAALRSSAVSAPVAYLHQRRDSVAEPQLGFEVARNPQWTSEPLYRAVQQAAPTLAAETSRADENSRSLHETMKRVVQIRELAEQVIEMRWLFEPQSQAESAK